MSGLLTSEGAVSDALPMLSLVVPLYQEGEGVAGFFARVIPVLESITKEWEILCVNDGSRDDTLAQIKKWHAREPRIKYLSLSRNFGKEAALTAGLHHAKGRAIIPIDADLQDPPEMIVPMVEAWAQGYKVVLATRRSRSGDSWLKRNTARIFYRMMGKVATVPVPANTGDFRLVDAQVVEVLKLLPERTRFMKGLFAWVGFTTTTLYFDREKRLQGAAQQNYKRLWQLAKDGIFSFTTLPLRLTTYLGVVISSFSFAYAFYLVLRTLLHGADLPGYASIMVAVLCMGGIQLISIGILGEYIGRIYRETKQRPVFVVEERGGV